MGIPQCCWSVCRNIPIAMHQYPHLNTCMCTVVMAIIELNLLHVCVAYVLNQAQLLAVPLWLCLLVRSRMYQWLISMFIYIHCIYVLPHCSKSYILNIHPWPSTATVYLRDNECICTILGLYMSCFEYCICDIEVFFDPEKSPRWHTDGGSSQTPWPVGEGLLWTGLHWWRHNGRECVCVCVVFERLRRLYSGVFWGRKCGLICASH